MLALAGPLALGSRSSALAPHLPAAGVPYALSATDPTLLGALTVVRARPTVPWPTANRGGLCTGSP